MPKKRILAVAAVLMVTLAGCGGRTDGVDGPATVVDLTYSAGGAVKTQTLDCVGTAAEQGASCALLKKLPASAFEPVPKDAMCTMIYGGPETATIKGQIDGKKVDAKFSRTNGCEIDRFKKVEPLFAEMAGN